MNKLQTAQLAAIKDSGWGLPFRLFQPRNAMFWLYAWAVAVGVVHTIQFYMQNVGNFGGVLLSGSVAFAIYFGLWLLFLGTVNRYTSANPKLLTAAFFWGFFAATITLAIVANDAILTLYAKLFGQAWALDWGAGLTAPFTEEIAKALGFIVLFGLARRLIRSAYDAFVVGAFIGLGFQVAENILYVYQGAQSAFGTNEFFLALEVIVVRSITGIASHALFSAIFCTGLFLALGWGAEKRRLAQGAGLMLLAMACHGVWDSVGALGGLITQSGVASTILMPTLLIIEVFIILWVARFASSTEQGWMRDLLAPEVTNGTITKEELNVVAGNRRDERKYIKSVHDRHTRRNTKHIFTAVRDLAEAIAKAKGTESDEVVFARTEIARLRTL